MVCLIRRLDSIKRLKAKEQEHNTNAKPGQQPFGVNELRDYQRESYQFRIKLGRLRQLRAEGGGAITQQNYHQSGLMSLGGNRGMLSGGPEDLLKKDDEKTGDKDDNDAKQEKEAMAAKLKAR